jgi:hypothetical protein
MMNTSFEPGHFEPVAGDRTVKDKVGIPKHAGAVGDAGIHLELRTNLFLGIREMGDTILRFLAQTGDIFVPEVFDGGKLTNGSKVKFDPDNLSLPLDAWVDQRQSLGIIAQRHSPVEVSIVVSASDFLMFDHLGMSVDSAWFTSSERLDHFVTVAKSLYEIVHANNGYIQNWRSERLVGELTDKYGNLVGYDPPKEKWLLKGFFWANFFGPEYVTMFGKDKLLSAPWTKAEELSDGGFLTLISNSPFDASKPEYQARKKALYTYFGDKAFTGSLLPPFRTEGRKKRDSRPLIQTGGVRDDVFH